MQIYRDIFIFLFRKGNLALVFHKGVYSISGDASSPLVPTRCLLSLVSNGNLILLLCGISPHFVRSGDMDFFLYLFICIREPSVVTWSLLGIERTLGMRKLYAVRKKTTVCNTCRLADLQTCRLADLQTWRVSTPVVLTQNDF